MKRKVGEKFEVGKANMEFPDYEIKIEGQTPITYADAINKRIKNITRIKKDFERKDKIMDEFKEENFKRLQETIADDMIAILRKMNIKDDDQLRDQVLKITNQFIDERMPPVELFLKYHEAKGNYNEHPQDFEKAYDILDRYAKEGENVDNMAVDELFVRAPEDVQHQLISLIRPSMQESLDFNNKLYKHAENLSSMLSTFIDEVSKINTVDFLTDGDFDTLNRAIEVLDGFATAYSYIMDNENVFESKKCPDCGNEICTCDKTSENLEEAGRATAELRKPRSVIKKEDKLYSRDDVWAKVYDELSSEVENEGPKGEIYKEVDIPRGKRFIGPYVGPGNDDLTVYAHIKDDLKWAKKIADHFGLKIDMKEDKNKTTNKYYPFYAILRNVSDAKVSDKEMEEYMSDID